MHISILGCGWLGLPLAKQLIKIGHNVKGSTRTNSKVEKLKVEGILPYVIDLKQLNDRLEAFLCSEILIIAITNKNIKQYIPLIQSIEKSSIQKVLFISSTSVYNNNNKVVTEKSILNESPLVQIEDLFLTNKHFKTTILRFAGLIGYDRKPGNFFLNNTIIENPEGYVNMIHQDDCIAIIEKIIELNAWGHSFNAACDSHPTRRDFYSTEIFKTRNKIPEFNKNSMNEFKIIDSSLLKKKLAYEFKHNDLLKLSIG